MAQAAVAIPRVAALPGSLARLFRSRAMFAFSLCLPLVIVVVGLVIYPAIWALFLAMLNKAQTKFVGLDNFEFLLRGFRKFPEVKWGDTFILVMLQSIGFTLSAVLLKSIGGLSAALLVNNLPQRGQRFWRGILLVAWVSPPALSSLGWWWIFDPTHSALNWAAVRLGFDAVPWLSNVMWARICMVIVGVWYGLPFFMIMYLAALKSIPQELYDAAAIDGANPLQRFRFVTFPMMLNIIMVVMMFSTIVTFATFDIVWVLTQGGPRNTTHMFATYSFKTGIQSGDLPLGAAISLFMVPVLAIAAFFVLRNVRRRVAEM